MKNILAAYSTKNSISEIIEDLKEQFYGLKSQMLIYFASSNIDQEKLAEELSIAFPENILFGCSTAGEIVSGKMLKNSVVTMGFFNNIIKKASVEVIEHIKDTSEEDIEEKVRIAFKNFEHHFGVSLKDMDFRKYTGIILIDGLSCAEEKLMEVIGDLTNVIFVGASAGDDIKFKETYVYANGHCYTNSAVLAIFEPDTDFDIIKTQSFCTTGKKLIANKVDIKTRTVIEFNNKPAVQAYAEALGVSIELAKNYFRTNPIGLMIKDEPYVRSPREIKENSIVFFSNLLEGMELDLLESTDIIKDTRKAIFDKINEIGDLSGIINFNCILRTFELEQKGIEEDYGKIFLNIPAIGFSTYGEEYLGHINQTSTMLVFK